MARATKAPPTPPTPAKRGPGRPRSVDVGPLVTPARSAAVPKRPAAARPPAPPPVSKGELRLQVEKLERMVATMRAKSREAAKGAKLATARIAELEATVAAFEQAPAPPKAAAKMAAKPPARGRRRGVDPGDAVPPGVAVQDPEPMDAEAEAAFENLKSHLRPA